MITVCIPVFNHCVVPLVEAVRRQSEGLALEVETVCIDDHSDSGWLVRNEALEGMCTYVKLPENVGRARIRNLFLQHARGEYMLFLDNDSILPEGFLQRYAAMLEAKPCVVVGGRIYPPESDDRQHHLRYAYGTRAESRPASEREKHPYQSFMTNNFMIRREVLEQIRFDERISLYGHEDTLFGYRLQQAGIAVDHIDNPVVNGEVETNADFLRKTIDGVHSLAAIYRFMEGDEDFVQSVRLLRAYRKLRLLRWPIRWAHLYTRVRSERSFLAGKSFSMTLFNFYKLGTFINTMHYENA